MGISILVIVPLVIVAAVVGYFVWKGMQPEVFLYTPMSGQSSPSSYSDAKDLLKSAISSGLDSATAIASKSQLKDAMDAGLSQCTAGWVSDGDVYLPNQTSGSSSVCGSRS